MAIHLRNQENRQALFALAERMSVAARTAPKTRGKDVIHSAIVDGEDMEKLAGEMKIIARQSGKPLFDRDAGNLLSSSVALLLGCEIRVNNLDPCGMCGFPDCSSKQEEMLVPCAFNSIDLGIAIGSAVSIAADARVDNRVMYTIGQAALNLGIFDESVTIVVGIPLSAKGKNIFFDRKK